MNEYLIITGIYHSKTIGNRGFAQKTVLPLLSGKAIYCFL